MQPLHSGIISIPGSRKTWTWNLSPILPPQITENHKIVSKVDSRRLPKSILKSIEWRSGPQGVHFSRFWGGFWEPLGTNFGSNFDILCDLRLQNGRQFPGPWFWWSRDGNDAWMRWLYVLEHCKNNGFWVVSLFPLIHEFGDLRGGFKCHFEWFWWPWADFFWFLRVLEIGLKCDDFSEVPWGNQGWGDGPKWG